LKTIDTTFLIDLLRGDAEAVKKAREIDEAGGAATTTINVFEITYGIFRSRHLDHDRRLSEVEKLLDRVDIFSLDVRTAILAGKILGSLSKEGKIIDLFDGMIGAMALANGCDTIVTRNVDHFKRIPDLRVETY